MKTYELDEKIAAIMARTPRATQVEIARRANLLLGVVPARLRGVAKFEGGVVVNGHDIAIERGYVVDMDDLQCRNPVTREETAVVHSILELQEICRADPDYLTHLPHDISGDPLREMLQVQSGHTC
jgi:hypothetical protein